VFSTVVTVGASNWAVVELERAAATAPIVELGLRLVRRGDAVEVRYSSGRGELMAAQVHVPADQPVMAGIMTAAPTGSGLRSTFSDLALTARS
jgi:regulation of enolase protein 1 (concanavalin A-like superfamily)